MAYQRAALTAGEAARGEASFARYVARMLTTSGRFRVSADTPGQAQLFQAVARRVSDMLGRPVVSYANGREILITFGDEKTPGLPWHSWPPPNYRNSTIEGQGAVAGRNPTAASRAMPL